MGERPKCAVCGEPMPEGEEMFTFHGYSGPCPVPPKMGEPLTMASEREETVGYVILRRWPDDPMWEGSVLFDTREEAEQAVERTKPVVPGKLRCIRRVVGPALPTEPHDGE